MFKAALKQYRKDVPSVGTVTYERAQQLLSEGRICRGWTEVDGQRQYFHVIKSPGNYPKKSLMLSDSEEGLFEMTIHLGMQYDIDLDDLLTESADDPDSTN